MSSEIGPIHRSQPTPPSATPRSDPPPQAAGQGTGDRADRVEFSQNARLLARIADLPEVRVELVEQARARVEWGYYDQVQVIDQAIDAMLEDLSA
jgi:hypothetical protein